ncbi:uncharacterized protein TrAtP1_010210 [Trichoderma atroviride]|uniref:N-acetyltransferase domain-containing protein n=1 Tax=Hypocrea atroviridis (strain ATCC 20476 / IMI 206040) TaxID=452589 RepID=G9NPY6_HYPAI|nr:uncharacterized protein TRIATDRAFT_46050 [Trichoderma atroviride IMI 206040]EHK47139.1 hypothetical protein TRIATDRAFT_46050 [Trichoderma atroviride IMI 206040]UKZ69200.1 hypothetical protein TrAtP1_010210 [Trichoderma atroviride]
MPSLSNLRLSPINLARDWDPLFRTFWKSWSIPRQAAMVATFPHIGEGGPEEAESFEVKKAQYLAAAKSSPGQMWYKVVDEEQPLLPIVGGICITHWKEEQQPRHMPDEPHEGFEPGSQIRKMSEQFYGQLHDWHSQIMRPREHVYGHAMWILPEYRQLRAAPMLMKVITDLCDEHDIEGYGEFVQMSYGLGVKTGFELVTKRFLKMNIENPTEDSQAMIKDFLSEPIHLMVRPKRSDLKSGRRPTFGGLKESKL